MKNVIFLLIFLISFCGNGQDISGNWSWQAENGQTLMEITLKAEGLNYTGSHCAVFQNGGRIDCGDETEPASIRIKRTAENVFEGTIRSGYSASEGQVNMTFNPDKRILLFKILEGPVDIYYLPKRAIFESSLGQERKLGKNDLQTETTDLYNQVVETVLDDYEGLDFSLCSKPLDYNVNSITTQGKLLIEALNLVLIADFQKWTPTGNAIPIKDILKSEDLNYMKGQIINGFEWQEEKLSVQVEDCEKIRNNIRLKFSKPLFNEEMNLSVVFLEQSSIADYSMSLILLRNENGNWKRLWSLAM